MSGRVDLDALIARAQEGDVEAFEALVEGHLGQVRRFARAFAASDADADDLAQEALLKVYRSLRSFRHQAAFSTWLFAVIRTTALDLSKARARRAGDRPLTRADAECPAGDPPADERLAQEQARRRVWDALRQVRLEFRSALVLFDLEGYAYEEVAAIEGVPVGTVRSRLARGRAELRRLLQSAEVAEPAAAPPRESGDGSGAHQPDLGAPGTSGGPASSHLRRSGA